MIFNDKAQLKPKFQKKKGYKQGKEFLTKTIYFEEMFNSGCQ